MLMAKYLIQIVTAGAQVVGRAFVRAVREEHQAYKHAASRHGGQSGSSQSKQEARKAAINDTFTGMSLQEARQILNVKEDVDYESLVKNYSHLFEVNDKIKGGSLYIQSKVVRAKERLDMEMKDKDKDINTETKRIETDNKKDSQDGPS
ncbi:mitochondrial import inner membrane translocase subunit tim16-B-like isoform X1 [Mytilus californianus]|uniref:mitochondrial import inner membrane translocase subunit tim16-B-like isoform X1 n=2 Tax=Mytilus californianus TaxID=6549 RepID=UPI002247C2A2|nr:mitochondrial import inner membrane translocase subunit tim16-B-like isoform X1 [Mytilus californianus]